MVLWLFIMVYYGYYGYIIMYLLWSKNKKMSHHSGSRGSAPNARSQCHGARHPTQTQSEAAVAQKGTA